MLLNTHRKVTKFHPASPATEFHNKSSKIRSFVNAR